MTEFTPRSLAELELEFPPDIAHLSATGLKTAMRCAEQYRRVYVKGQRKAPSLSMVAGRADHKAIEISMEQKIETGEDLPVNQVQSEFLRTLEEEVESSGGLKELEDKPDTATWDQTRRLGEIGVGQYQRLVSPSITPVAVEEEFSLDLPGLPVPLIGYLDLVGFAGAGGKLRIIDRKRSKRAPYNLAPDWRFQASLYQLHRPLPHDWHVTVASPRSRNVDIIANDPRFTLAPDDPKVATQLVSGVAAQIGFLYQRYGPDEEWPATGVTHPFACGYCGFRPECWAWKGER